MTGYDTVAELRRAGPWEFLRSFARAWQLPARPAWDQAAIEQRLDRPIPEMLCVAYGTGVFDLRGLHAEDGILVFHSADPLVAEASWGITLDGADPAVLIDNGAGWMPYAPDLPTACVTLALTAAVETDRPGDAVAACELDADEVAAAVAQFERVPLEDHPMWIDVEEGPVRWYSRPGRLIRTHGEGGAWLWVRGQTPDDLEAIRAALPGVHWAS
ncbi:hypothetical protein KOI35_20605 [Actinoplanes bogorensis]|uniref:Uncharacterized protein n=1 Tax=Paractinoplanes bogorensis TaxID=1610840 RepID=A0ABS5YS47_9ACTN|nr:hypothetical protein [Actinoplanes bogorensis]MBU2665916.1 hypothetical protein [Actinoplanes bogorensis]